MSSIFPLRETVSLDDREPRLVELDEETADEVFEALASRTTREIFLELHHSPQTASDLADVTDTSVQNAQYHLEKLLDAELVEVVDTWYSERGSEMKVYAPKDESLVLFAGQDKKYSLRRLLNRVMGVLGVLVPSSALVGLGARWQESQTASGAAAEGDTTDADGTADTADGGSSGSEGTEDGTDAGDANGGDQSGDSTVDLTTEGDNDVGTNTSEYQGDPQDNGTIDINDSVLDNATAPDNSTIADNATMPDNSTATETVANNATEAADAAASLDPLLAAGLFFFGGLVVFGALTVWHGSGRL